MTSARCRDLCLDQPLLGSASLSHRLVLVDQPRPWPAKIQKSLSLSPQWQARLDRWRVDQVPFTLLARHSEEGQIQCFGWEQGQVSGAPAGETLLVCTHGSRDACCGWLGVRLAGALRQAGHQRVWEVSHIGGHRFAPTLWHLPEWRVYGRVNLENPSLDLQTLRGNAAYSPRLQVMEAYLFQQRGVWPDWLEETPAGCRAHWAGSEAEFWAFEMESTVHSGPLSCRDIPEGKLEPYTSWRVRSGRANNEQLSTP
ncbi:MAG: sucrase ferredoxin [Vulcanimicrobiota bacterium]